MRDAWAKAQKRLASDSLTLNGRYPKKYVFQEQLAFLKKVIKIKSNDSGAADDTESEAGSDIDQDSDSVTTDHGDRHETIDGASVEASSVPCSSNTNMPRRKRKLDLDGYEDRPIYLRRTSKMERENRHILFFRSLIPSLCKLNEEQILEFQVGVLKLMQSVRKTASESSGGDNLKIEDYSS